MIDLIKWQVYIKFLFYLFPVILVLFVRILAELNRSPMDFIEGESELVSGFNIEYFRGSFALIFMGEYGIIIFFRYLISILFLGSINFFYLFIYINLFVVLIIFIRGILPRIRYDELIYLC